MPKSSRAMLRLTLRLAYGSEFPAAMCLATQSLVRGSNCNRLIAMMLIALLAARSLPLFNSCRRVLPYEAGSELTPYKGEKLASDRNFSGLSAPVGNS